ncbi:MAG: hypothetical protein KatS3mg057_2673 [Herpetosiphonaceae bacterium]|nr:MAG: hypothetical protein KatS3mg057_2673 [Herpetosiphonaceae bacterium]
MAGMPGAAAATGLQVRTFGDFTAASVGPGFDNRRAPGVTAERYIVRQRRDGAAFAEDLAAVPSDVDLLLIETWNEWWGGAARSLPRPIRRIEVARWRKIITCACCGAGASARSKAHYGDVTLLPPHGHSAPGAARPSRVSTQAIAPLAQRPPLLQIGSPSAEPRARPLASAAVPKAMVVPRASWS